MRKVPGLRFEGFEEEWEERKLGDFAQKQSNTMVSDSETPCVEYGIVI